MAKNADNSIPGPLEWMNSFEIVPLDEVFMPVIYFIVDSCVSKKKAQGLMKGLKKRKSTQTSSSLEVSTEA